MVAAAIVGGAATGLVMSVNADSLAPTRGDIVVPSYPKNEFGETYGSNALAETSEQEPDLVAAVGTRGEEGFVRKEDLSLPDPSSPAEAVKRQLEQELSGGGRLLPLYEVDGRTIIGEFLVGYDPGAVKG